MSRITTTYHLVEPKSYPLAVRGTWATYSPSVLNFNNRPDGIDNGKIGFVRMCSSDLFVQIFSSCIETASRRMELYRFAERHAAVYLHANSVIYSVDARNFLRDEKSALIINMDWVSPGHCSTHTCPANSAELIRDLWRPCETVIHFPAFPPRPITHATCPKHCMRIPQRSEHSKLVYHKRSRIQLATSSHTARVQDDRTKNFSPMGMMVKNKFPGCGNQMSKRGIDLSCLYAKFPLQKLQIMRVRLSLALMNSLFARSRDTFSSSSLTMSSRLCSLQRLFDWDPDATDALLESRIIV